MYDLKFLYTYGGVLKRHFMQPRATMSQRLNYKFQKKNTSVTVK